MATDQRSRLQPGASGPTDGTDGQYGARLEQRNSSLLNQHQRHKDLTAEEGPSEQPPRLNNLREATRESQESGWHERWQRHEKAGQSGNHEHDREPVRSLTRELQHGGGHGKESGSPQWRGFLRIRVAWLVRAHHTEQAR
jgi:hypothetical protein